MQERGSLRCGLYRFQVEGTYRYQLVRDQPLSCLTCFVSSYGCQLWTFTSWIVSSACSCSTQQSKWTWYSGSGYKHKFCNVERKGRWCTGWGKDLYNCTIGSWGDHRVALHIQHSFLLCYHECSELRICVITSATDYKYIEEHFSTGFFVTTADLEERPDVYSNETCNVVATSRLDLLNYKFSHGELLPQSFVIGEKYIQQWSACFCDKAWRHWVEQNSKLGCLGFVLWRETRDHEQSKFMSTQCWWWSTLIFLN